MGLIASLRFAHFLGLSAQPARKPAARIEPIARAMAAPPAQDLAAARQQERARCAAIIGSASGLRFTPMALQLAIGTDLPAAEAIAILDSCAKDQAKAPPPARPSLAQRMAALGDEANPAPGPGALTLPAEQAPAASILASADKARGQHASPLHRTHP